MTREMRLFDGRVYGAKVSDYGLERGYLDYRALAQIIGDCILNNYIRPASEYGEWELVSGNDCFGLDIDGRECDLYSDECVDTVYYDIYQDYIITEQGANFLFRYTDEIVYYNSEIDMYIWGITHYGTSWDYVLTNIKLVKEEF